MGPKDLTNEQLKQAIANYAGALNDAMNTAVGLMAAVGPFIVEAVTRLDKAPEPTPEPVPEPGPEPLPESEPEPAPTPVPGVARAHALETAKMARQDVVDSIAAMHASPFDIVDEIEMLFDEKGRSSDYLFEDGNALVLASTSTGWELYTEVSTQPLASGLSDTKALWTAIEYAGKWGTVHIKNTHLRSPPPAALVHGSWQGGSITHEGPVRLIGDPVGALRFGTTAPSMWIECDVRAAAKSNWAAGNGVGDVVDGWLVMRDNTVGATGLSPEYNAAPIKWAEHYGGQFMKGVARIRTQSLISDEHGEYFHNAQFGHYEQDCKYAATTRCSLGQFVNRMHEGPASTGHIAIVRPTITISRRWSADLAANPKGTGGGGSITVAGHTGGRIAIIDPVFIAGATGYPVPPEGSHGNLIVIWGEPGNSVYRRDSGYSNGEVAICGVVLIAEDGIEYTPDREAINIQSCETVYLELPHPVYGGDVSKLPIQARTIAVKKGPPLVGNGTVIIDDPYTNAERWYLPPLLS